MHDPLIEDEAATASLQEAAAEQQRVDAEAAHQWELAAQSLAAPLAGNNRSQGWVALGEQDAPLANYRNCSTITPPAILSQDYEIKPHIITLVKQNQFHRLSTENPMDHIDIFEEICNTTSSSSMPHDYLRYKIFSFS